MFSSHGFLLFRFSHIILRNFLLPIILYLGGMCLLLLWSTLAYAVVFIELILYRCIISVSFSLCLQHTKLYLSNAMILWVIKISSNTCFSCLVVVVCIFSPGRFC